MNFIDSTRHATLCIQRIKTQEQVNTSEHAQERRNVFQYKKKCSNNLCHSFFCPGELNVFMLAPKVESRNIILNHH